jgi:ferritin-like metal-binding protein YciE
LAKSPDGETTVPARTPKEVFLTLLSNVRNRTERQSEVYQEIGKHAEEPEIKEAIEARAFVSKHILAKLDECFRIIGEWPVDSTGKLQETSLEDFRKEVTEIQSPVAKRLFVLAKLNHLAHLRMAEYEVLIAAADLAGHHGVGVLLETCLADKLVFAKRIRRLIRHLAEAKLAERAAGA